jgi:2-oxoglutarate dehydrogenase E2 component (dihydrolipoamide succinyltransferase)
MDIIVPQVGESIVEAEIGEWFKKDGEHVNKDDLLMELETEKVNVELNAEASGKLTITAQQGDVVKIGAVIGTIDESAAAPVEKPATAEATTETKKSAPEAPAPAQQQDAPMNPAVPKIAAERGVDVNALQGSGRDGRILVDDIPQAAQPAVTPKQESADKEKTAAAVQIQERPETGERTTRVAMTQIRKKIAAHLMKARHETAMLTTFNEIDMSKVINLRKTYKEPFQKKYGIGLGFMSFFVKACAEALLEYREVNARIDGNDIIYHNYVDIGVAVGGKRGLIVPVIRNADKLSFAEIEQIIRTFAEKASSGKITLAELEGGTFTVSNGGIYGSVLSTPLLNPPQSGILGMHAIEERPVVRNGEIVIRPMMNIALSYDHRIIDGKEAVGFLKQVKSYIDNPESLLIKV